MDLNELMKLLYSAFDGGKLICIAGRPGSGKSTCIKQAVNNLINEEQKIVYYFSLSKEENDINENFEEILTKDKNKNGRLLFNDTAALDIGVICNLCKSVEPGAVIIDYFNLVTDKADVSGTRIGELNSIATKLSALAKQLEVPILLETPLSRYGSKGQTSLSLNDLRCSGDIGTIADNVFFVE